MFRGVVLSVCLLLGVSAHADTAQNINEAIDQFHAAAARGDQAAYLSLLTDDAVFLGTDVTERWQGQAFRDFVAAHFANGKGWTYHVAERKLAISYKGDTAWFDELLDNEKLGRCRGSGVLVRNDLGWKIAQYNLSVPVPNSVVVTLAAAIKALNEGGVLEVEVGRYADGALQSVEIEVEVNAARDADGAAEDEAASARQ